MSELKDRLAGAAVLTAPILQLWPHLDKSHRLILPVLLSYWPEMRPSHDTLADRCNRSRRTIIRILDELVGLGVLRVGRRFGDVGRLPNIYTIDHLDDESILSDLLARLELSKNVTYPVCDKIEQEANENVTDPCDKTEKKPSNFVTGTPKNTKEDNTKEQQRAAEPPPACGGSPPSPGADEVEELLPAPPGSTSSSSVSSAPSGPGSGGATSSSPKTSKARKARLSDDDKRRITASAKSLTRWIVGGLPAVDLPDGLSPAELLARISPSSTCWFKASGNPGVVDAGATDAQLAGYLCGRMVQTRQRLGQPQVFLDLGKAIAIVGQLRERLTQEQVVELGRAVCGRWEDVRRGLGRWGESLVLSETIFGVKQVQEQVWKMLAASAAA